ncbi:MAG: FMN-binding protein [Pseudomonadota bacterium]
MIKQIISLTLIAGVCGLVLSGTRTLTAPGIAANRAAAASELYAELLGQPLPADWFSADSVPDAAQLLLAPQGSCETWLFTAHSEAGYAAAITLIGLWRPPGLISARVVSHLETPGIGDFIDHSRDNWLPALDQSSATEIAALDNVSGATITTNAIRRSLQTMLRNMEKHCVRD